MDASFELEFEQQRIARLAMKPLEYLQNRLHTTINPWQEEDTALVGYYTEIVASMLKEKPELVDFLNSTEDDQLITILTPLVSKEFYNRLHISPEKSGLKEKDAEQIYLTTVTLINEFRKQILALLNNS